jgi:hypothetical protein
MIHTKDIDFYKPYTCFIYLFLDCYVVGWCAVLSEVSERRKEYHDGYVNNLRVLSRAQVTKKYPCSPTLLYSRFGSRANVILVTRAIFPK